MADLNPALTVVLAHDLGPGEVDAVAVAFRLFAGVLEVREAAATLTPPSLGITHGRNSGHAADRDNCAACGTGSARPEAEGSG